MDKKADGSTTIPFEKGKFKLHDDFFGGEPFGGRIIVFHKNKPVWVMVYYGYVVKRVETDSVYAVLRKALMKMPKSAPFRGPKEFKNGKFTYANNWNGDLEKYSGEEKITYGEKLIYKANYMGG